jgi:ElaB/YqjD/DUF883 family membrane-anchored ribosome-binding protein
MVNEDAGKSTVDRAVEQGRKMGDQAENSVKETYEAAREYAEGIDVVDFVRREPWLALALASALGFCFARIMRPNSGRVR